MSTNPELIRNGNDQGRPMDERRQYGRWDPLFVTDENSCLLGSDVNSGRAKQAELSASVREGLPNLIGTEMLG
jgi:hypothetical protein